MRRPATTASAFAFLLFAASAVEARPNPVAHYLPKEKSLAKHCFACHCFEKQKEKFGLDELDTDFFNGPDGF